MKNILLATTALVMTAGFASAEVKFSGKAEGGIFRAAPTAATTTTTTTTGSYTYVSNVLTKGTGTNTAPTAAQLAAAKTLVVSTTLAVESATAANLAAAIDAQAAAQAALALAIADNSLIGVTGVAKGASNDLAAYSGYDFDVTLSGTSDNGITFGTSFDMGAGSLADTTDDLALEAQNAVVGAPTVSASMNGYTLKISSNNDIDDLYDDSQNGEISVSGTLGTVSFAVVHDLQEDVAASAATYVNSATAGADTYAAAVAAVYETTSYKLGTTIGGIGLSLIGTDHNDVGLSAMKAKATYTMDALTFGLESNNRGDSTKKLNATKISLAYAGEGVSASVSSNDDKDWDASATLSAGANSATFSTDEESAWDAQVASDLGGGASVFGYVDSTELFMAGVRFTF